MFEVREATEADHSEIEALIGEMIPGVDVGARWKWLYETNPGGRALTWFAIADGKVAGCTSMFPFRLWLDGKEVRGALGGDGYVRPAFRRHGIGAKLHDASRLAMPKHRLGCMYGAPGEMNLTPLKHGGSREVGHVTRWVRPIRSEALRLPGVLSPLLRPRTQVRLEPAVELDERIDRLWTECRDAFRLACVRDAAFYTWRFHEAPAQRQPTYIVVDRGTPIGACALEALEHGRIHRIIDLLAAPAHWPACLAAITRFCADTTPAALVDIKLFERDGRSRPLLRSGFTEREHKPFLCMIPAHGDRRFLDADRWFYTQADSDLDDHR
ncbi:MAG: GNAT family N-acetyltransferase [Kofleriaceae bacterium]